VRVQAIRQSAILLRQLPRPFAAAAIVSTTEAPSGTGQPTIFVVEVRHNLVSSIKRETLREDSPPPKTKLETGTQLAENFQRNGCIDGRYRFENEQRARIFATLCLEFTQALIARRLDEVRKLHSGDEYDSA
jgi:hypothetical protein